MLDKDVFIKNMELLLSCYPSWSVDLSDRGVARTWYNRFAEFENDRFAAMVDSYIENEKYHPTVAGLKLHDIMPRKTIAQIKHEEMLKENGLA